MADQDQQDLDDEVRLQRGGERGGAAGGKASLAGMLLAVAGGALAEMDVDAAEALATGAALGAWQRAGRGERARGAGRGVACR